MLEDLLCMQSQNMRNNLIFAKIQETENEDLAKTEAIVRDSMVEKLQIAKSMVDDIKFEHVHRMGAETNAYSRNSPRAEGVLFTFWGQKVWWLFLKQNFMLNSEINFFASFFTNQLKGGVPL